MRSVVVRHESPGLGRYERVERGAHPELAGIVNRYCGYTHRGTGQASRREVAQDQVTIIIGVWSGIARGRPRPSRVGRAVVRRRTASVLRRHHGIRRPRRRTDRPVPARRAHVVRHGDARALGPPGGAIRRRAWAEAAGADRAAWSTRSDWDARFELLDVYIWRRIQAARAPSPDVAWACRRLRDTGGRLEVGALAAELGCSNRHLAARFREQVGLPPKTVSSLIRFQRAVDRLSHDDGSRFAEIATDCGYYDQAHLNREFRRLAGTTPGAFVAQPAARRAWVRRRQVRFIQDAARDRA